MAPADLPSGGTVQVTATSHADRRKSSSASVTVSSGVAVSNSCRVPVRPSSQVPDAPLADDDRTGLRILYPDPGDTLYVGSIQGHIIPANPISLLAAPPGVTGVFGAHVVAVDATSGSVIAGSMGGWSCTTPGPAQFDGNYEIARLPVGRSYKVYAEPLDGAVAPSEVSNALVTLCRNATTNLGWPPLQGCVVPNVDTAFATRTRP